MAKSNTINKDVTVAVDRMHKWDKGACKASVDITVSVGGLNFKIYNASLMYSDKNDDYFIAMPNRKGADGKYYSFCYIDDKDVMEQIATVALAEYEK